MFSFSETKHEKTFQSLKIAAMFYIFSICASNYAVSLGKQLIPVSKGVKNQ